MICTRKRALLHRFGVQLTSNRQCVFRDSLMLETCIVLKSTAERRSLGPTAISQSEKRAGVPAIHGPLGWPDYRFQPVTAMTPIASRLTAVHLLTDSPRMARKCRLSGRDPRSPRSSSEKWSSARCRIRPNIATRRWNAEAVQGAGCQAPTGPPGELRGRDGPRHYRHRVNRRREP
jgi:hypothetical protein